MAGNSKRFTSRFFRWFILQVGLQGLLVLAIVWVGFLIVDGVYVRWDLTEDARFTISDASKKLVKDLEDPLTIRVYMSESVPPRIQPLQRQVLDILAEYEAANRSKVKVERYDPDASQTAQNEAKNYNIRPVQMPVYEATSVQVLQIYGGIVLVYQDRNSEVVDFASRYPQGYEGLSAMEYEISSKIWQLSNERPRIGITGYLTSVIQNPMAPGRPQQAPKFTSLRRILGEAFEIEDVDLKQEGPDPAKIPMLLIVRPKAFTDVETFRLDQYLMKGGRVIMFVSKGEIQQTRWNPNITWAGFSTGLDAWMEHHGLRIPDEFVLHGRNANMIRIVKNIPPLGDVETQGLSWFRPRINDEDSIDKDNPAVQTLREIAMFWPHPVDVLDDRLASGVESTVLIKSHATESWRWKNLRKVDMKLVNMREEGPKPEQLRSSPLVVALEGKFRSFYNKPGSIPPSLKEKSKDDKGKEEIKDPEVIKTSVKTGHLVVVGNSIFISDDVLGGGQRGPSEAAREATLLAFNLIDWLARSEDLIALRAKKYSKREIKDEDFKDDIEELKEEGKAGKLTEDQFRQKFDEARERQKDRRKRWRWKNIMIPSFLIILAGSVVWILRAANRTRKTKVPAAVPPKSLSE